MNKIFRKISSILLVVCFVICLTLLNTICLNNTNQKTVSADDVTPTLTVSVTKDEDGKCFPSTSKMIYFNLSLDVAPTQDVVVSIHAEDRTAIAEAGDYYYVSDETSSLTNEEKAKMTHKTTEIVINANNYTSVMVGYQVEQTTYATYLDSTSLTTNYFMVFIDDVKNANYNGDKEFWCRMSYQYSYDLDVDSNGYYYYSPFRKMVYKSWATNRLVDYTNQTIAFTVADNELGASIGEIYSKTVGLGWGNFHMCYFWVHMGADRFRKDDTKSHVLFGGDINKKIVEEGVGHVNTGGENYYDNDAEHMDFDEIKFVPDYTESFGNRTHTFFIIPQDYGYTYTIYFDNQCSTTRWGNGESWTRLSDDDAPELIGSYCDTSSVTIDGKIHVALRFSEVVNGSNTSINAFLQDTYNLLFKYVTGTGTNTLYYESSIDSGELMKKSLTITKLRLDSMNGDIVDMGYNWKTKAANKADIHFDSLTINCDIDLRKPQISYTTTQSNKASATRTVNVIIDQLNQGTLYYCWTKEETGSYDTVEDFKNTILNGGEDKYAGSKEIKLGKNVSTSTHVIGSPNGLNGEYYLHVLAVSAIGKTDKEIMGKVQGASVISGFTFDNNTPTISVTKSTTSSKYNMIYDVVVDESYSDSSITANPSGVYLIGLKMYDGSEETKTVKDYCIWCDTDNINHSVGKVDLQSNGSFNGQFEFKINPDEMTLNGFGGTLQLSKNNYGTYYYYFYAIDNAGNTTLTDTYEFSKEKYDIRNQFKAIWTANKDSLYATYNGVSATGVEENVYDMSKINETDFAITFINDETEMSSIDYDVLSINKLYYGSNNNLVYSDETGDSYDEYITVNQIVDGKKTNISVTPLIAGYYRFELKVARRVTGLSSDIYLYTMDDFEFYFTNRYATDTPSYEFTTNYLNSKGNLVLNNKVYQINSSFTYLNEADKVLSIPYNNTYSPASFSSVEKATEYLKYMEFQDLQLLVLDAPTATFLNGGGSTKYQKADGQDSINAVAGQTWIRYKRSSWTDNSELEGWAYYYYSSRTESTISISLLNTSTPLLIQAMNTIVDGYLAKAKWVYLVDEDHLDRHNTPYLAAGQIHATEEFATKTMTGVNYSVILTYEGDANIYQNTSAVNGEILPIGTNMQLQMNPSTKLYYVTQVAGSYQLNPINAVTGQTLSDILKDNVGSGSLTIVELDANGVSEFNVCNDVDAPVISVSWVTTGNNNGDKTSTADLNINNNGAVYSAKTMTISSSSFVETDDLAYIVIYNAPSYNFVSMTYIKDLFNNPITLTDGNYYVVVGDRSGNVYTFTVKVNSEELIVTVEIVDGKYVSVKTNREENQIDRYEVRRNNILVTNVPYNEKGNKYSEDGYYTVYVKDIYGYTNSKDGSYGESIAFERELPQLNWYYLNSSGTYTSYDANMQTTMKITESLATHSYYINTSRTLRFTFDDELAYSFEGVEASEIVSSQTQHYVNINTTNNWKMKIWYVAYPEVVATYVCTNDTTAPDITCSYKENTYELEEQNAMSNAALTAPFGSPYYLSSILYTKTGTSTNNIANGGQVFTNLINVKVEDRSGVQSVDIYLDGTLYKQFTDLGGTFPGCTVSRTGEYTIIAKDVFGNQRTIQFSNNHLDYANASMNEETISENANQIFYGNDTFKLVLKHNGTIQIKLNGYFLYYTYNNGQIITTKYVCTDMESDGRDFLTEYCTKTILNEFGKSEVVDDVIFDANLNAYKGVTLEYVANNQKTEELSLTKIEGVHFYLECDRDGNVCFIFQCDDANKMDLEVSVLFDNLSDPYYYHSLLSKEQTNVTLKNEDSTIISAANNKVVRTNKQFEIDSDSFDFSNIKKIDYAFSSTKEFIEYKTLFENNDFVQAMDTEKNGFYQIRIVNIYGNEVVYTINRSDVFVVLAYAVYEDYVESRFDSTYGEQLIKSNSKIKLEAYTDYDEANTFVVTKQGSNNPLDVKWSYDNGYYQFNFEEAGIYQLTATDNFGNIVIKNFEINKSNIEFNKDYINGYNEQALLKDAGYTNKELTIDINKTQNDNIQYISTVYSTETSEKGNKVVTKVEKILYNALTQDKVGLNSKYVLVVTTVYTYKNENESTITSLKKEIVDLLTGEIYSYEDNSLKKAMEENNEFTNKYDEVIGKDGNNDYTVIFRDSFGSIARKEIHFNKQSTLVVTSQTRSGKTQVLETPVDVYSNGTVTLSTTSKKFECYKTANNNREILQGLPFVFAFSSDNGSGIFNYDIEYKDEYGNSYQFTIHLVRQVMEITPDENMLIQAIDNVDTTRDNISVTFTENAKCVYRLDSGEEIIYNKGDILYKDGTYRFTVSDLAGNFVTKVIRKDTVCQYTFVAQTTERVLINGDIVNNGSVKFYSSTNDTTFVSRVYHNNQLLSDANSVFSKDGVWDILVEDRIGNIEMFEFTIITHKLSHFEYTTPNNFKIAEFWYNSGDDILINNLEAVVQNGDRSSFSITQDGIYTVVMTSELLSKTIDFTFTIDTSIPQISLDGCKEGERTINSVTLNGCVKGDTVTIYKDGDILEVIEIENMTDVPVISDGGKYKIVVTNEAGVSTTLEFTRTGIANGAGSALIIALCMIYVVGIVIGTCIRNRQKIDD